MEKNGRFCFEETGMETRNEEKRGKE